MVINKWQSLFPKNTKPSYEELLMFLPEKVRLLFLKFNYEMNNVYQVYNKWHRYEKNAGWVYGYCRNYHECHVTVMSGDKGRSVCVNLIEGTISQLKDMLEMLAGH